MALGNRYNQETKILFSILTMPTSSIVKQELIKFLTNLLNYEREKKSLSATSPTIEIKWKEKDLIVRTTLQDLVSAKIFEPTQYCLTSSKSKYNDRVRYLLLKILKDKLEILEDQRTKNNNRSKSDSSAKGSKYWKFTLKLWYSPKELSYIERNIIAFNGCWHDKHNNKSSQQFIYQNLRPRLYTQLFGYQTEWNQLLELLSPHSRERIICIEGMGGIGKTSLALEVAYYCLDKSRDFDDPLYFHAIIDTCAKNIQVLGNRIMPTLLEPEKSSHDIVRAIAETIEFPIEPSLNSQQKLKLLLNHLKDKLVLLIIDNLETIEDGDAIALLIANFPETVKIIITSRIPFALPNSCSITLNPLKPEAGAELIEDLAKKWQRNLSPEQISWIYEKTGGLPLAITYLIAQIVTTSIPNELMPMVVNKTSEELLRFCFDDLVKSLSNTPAYQCLLITALFAEFANVKAIAFINQTTIEITSKHLQHLTRLHLISQASQQYSLHSLTQEYLQLELQQQEDYLIQIRARQIQWYQQLVAPYLSVSADEWHSYQELKTEWRNLRYIIEYCLNIGERYVEVKKFWYALKGFTSTLGYWSERKVWLNWLLQQAQQREDWQMVAEAMFHQSQTLAYVDERDGEGKAIKLALLAWDLKEYCPVEWQFDLSLYITALYIRQQNPDSYLPAQQWLDNSQELFDTLPVNIPLYLQKKCQLFYYQAELYTQSQQLEIALNTYQTALEIAKAINYQRGIAYIRSRISIILFEQSKLNQAQQELSSLLDLTQQYGDRRSSTFCYQYLAIVAKRLDNPQEAKHYAALAQQGFNNLGMEAAAAEMEKFL
ncbi:ECF subfamily RNA polymerase sigma-24 factor [Chondrocystis sp. NIES-4102]|nr:ECF subfamily RNA polymerase sigma-24 factor [Chondrocystis sp. NIES-4102]